MHKWHRSKTPGEQKQAGAKIIKKRILKNDVLQIELLQGDSFGFIYWVFTIALFSVGHVFVALPSGQKSICGHLIC